VTRCSRADRINGLHEVVVISHRRTRRGIDERCLCRGRSNRRWCFASGCRSAEDAILCDGRTAVIRRFPGQISAGHIALARETSRFRRERRRGVGVGIEALEKALPTGLARYAHVRDEVVRPGARDTTGTYATIAVAVKHTTSVVDR